MTSNSSRKRIPCSALVNGWCINGFPVTEICRQTEMIGEWQSRPFCLREEQCGRLYEDSGGKPPEYAVRRCRELAGFEE